VKRPRARRKGGGPRLRVAATFARFAAGITGTTAIDTVIRDADKAVMAAFTTP